MTETDPSDEEQVEGMNDTNEKTVEMPVETLKTLLLAADERTPLTQLPDSEQVNDAVRTTQKILDE